MKTTIKHNWSTGSRLLLVLSSIVFLLSCEDRNCIKGEGAVETRILEIEPFTRIESNGDFKVYLTQGAVQKIEVKGEPNILDQLQTNISNSTWDITHESCIRKSKTVEVYITLPAIESLYLNGSGSIEGQNSFTTSEIEVAVNGSGRVNLDVDASKIISRVTGSGKVQLQGSAPLHSVNISGSGRTETFDLASDRTAVTISGSGIAQVRAATALDVLISGSGIVYYKGEPDVSQQISGSGKVVKQ